MEEMRFTCSSHKIHLENTNMHAVNNIVLDPRNNNIIILQNDTYLFVLEKVHPTRKGTECMKNGKSYRKNSDIHGKTEPMVADLKLKFYKKIEHFVHLSRLSNAGELVAVGVNPVTLLEQLPPSMRQKKFGGA